MLEFDAKTAAFLENAYNGSDFTARRRASFDALSIEPGEAVLDLGCGNGMMLPELARATGDTGHVIGIDPSDDMRSLAVRRCENMANVTVQQGSATDLPLAPESIDKAVSLQVFEYIEDISEALQGLARVLRRGGRLVIGDLHFETLTWHSDDPDRMRAMAASWDQHVAHRDLPAILPPALRGAGFSVEAVRPVCVTDHLLRPDGYARLMLHLMARYAIGQGHLTEDEVNAWADEQHQLARDGRFFFSITHYVTTARRL